MKATLFVRSTAGLQLTADGRRFFESALDAEAAIVAVDRVRERSHVGGTVRLSVSEGFGTEIVAPALPDLRAAHPALKIELAAQTGFLSPGRREVDIAVTLSPPRERRLVVEPLTDYELGLFSSKAYLSQTKAPKALEDLSQHEIVGYVDELIYAAELRYLEEIHPGLSATLSSTSIRAQRKMIAAGGGLGVLPVFLSGGLIRVLPRQIRLMRRFWLSVHRDVADTARIRSVRNWLVKLVAANKRMLAPSR